VAGRTTSVGAVTSSSAPTDGALALFVPDGYVHRPPVGEWVCLDARTRFGSAGTGAAESAPWDAEGRIGRAVQSLFVEVAQ
jgi:hypothetical protein